jgi:hypothetical protein
MFSLFNGIYDSYLAPIQLNLLIVGPPNAGKSALLERLKVTDIPTTKPRRHVSSSSDGSNQNNKNLGRVEDLTVALYTALVETGAADIVGRRKSSVVVMTSGGGDANSRSISPKRNPTTPEEVNRRLAAAANAEQETSTGVGKTTTTTNDASVTRPRRRLFRLNICPAPERYLQAAQAQDEDFEENDHDTEQKELLASFHDGATTTTSTQSNAREGQDSFSSDPPQRVRCHSKEFNVDSLDLMDGRPSSMQDIPLVNNGNCDKPISPLTKNDLMHDRPSNRTSRHQLPSVQGHKLLQSCSDELYVRSNAKMLSLMKIRPTSKCSIYPKMCTLSSLLTSFQWLTCYFFLLSTTQITSWIQPGQIGYVRRQMSRFRCWWEVARSVGKILR